MSNRSDPYQSLDINQPAAVSRTVINEERKTLERQYEMMQHIDDRALRITRTSTVLLGITFTGLSLLVIPSSETADLIVPNISYMATCVGSIGIFSITTSLFIGIVTTQYSRPIYGIGEKVRHRIGTRQSEQKALSEMSNEYDDAISAMQSRLERNRRLLWVVQIVFIIGLISLIIGSSFALSDAVRMPSGTNTTNAVLTLLTVTNIRGGPVSSDENK